MFPTAIKPHGVNESTTAQTESRINNGVKGSLTIITTPVNVDAATVGTCELGLWETSRVGCSPGERKIYIYREREFTVFTTQPKAVMLTMNSKKPINKKLAVLIFPSGKLSDNNDLMNHHSFINHLLTRISLFQSSCDHG